MPDTPEIPEASKPGDEARAVIDARIAREQAILLDQLKKTPIVQLACEKLGIGRTTYYRWRKDDAAFAQAADEALQEGITLMNDMAESQLLTQVREGNLGGITYWLKHRHPAYGNRMELTAKVKTDTDTLTPEQEAVVRQALEMATFSDPSINAVPPPVSPSPPSHELASEQQSVTGNPETLRPDVQGPSDAH